MKKYTLPVIKLVMDEEVGKIGSERDPHAVLKREIAMLWSSYGMGHAARI